MPPLLRPLARRGIDEVEAIADAVLGRRGGPPPPRAPEDGTVQRVLIALTAEDSGSEVEVEVRIGGEVYGSSAPAPLPTRLLSAQEKFLRGFREGIQRDPLSYF